MCLKYSEFGGGHARTPWLGFLARAGSFRRAGPRGGDSVMSPQSTSSLSHQKYPRTGQDRHDGAGGAPRGRGPIVRGLTRPGWCGWGFWGDPGRERVQICHKGAPDRERRREEARNINDSPPALRHDRGLRGRFGQPASPWTPGWAARAAATAPWRPPAPRGALRTRTCSSNRHSRVRSAPLGDERAGRGRRGPRRRQPIRPIRPTRPTGIPLVRAPRPFRGERPNERRAPPLPLCYALFSSLRLFTLCCTEKRSVAEGERAQRRERGVADGSARPREPRSR